MGTAVDGVQRKEKHCFVWGPHREAQLPAPLARCGSFTDEQHPDVGVG